MFGISISNYECLSLTVMITLKKYSKLFTLIPHLKIITVISPHCEVVSLIIVQRNLDPSLACPH